MEKQSLSIKDLRGTNTAIHCKTQANWDKVSEIAGYEWEAGNWRTFKEKSTISLRNKLYCNINNVDDSFTIIPAADFIAANQPEAEQVEIKEGDVYVNKNNGGSYQIISNKDGYISCKLPSDNTHYRFSEHEFFDYFYKKPLYNAETNNQNNMSDYVTKTELQETFQKLSDRLTEKLAKETRESFDKWLAENREKSGKAEPIEPNPVKFPVTIEEVWNQEFVFDNRKSIHITQGGLLKDTEFDGSTVITEFRQESTAKKARAFLTLLKIAEAQNEITERGEKVYCAYLIHNEIIVDNNRIFSYGQIPFHSEQGLLYCIAANKELWMDLLKGE